jgi:hypothetical protein
MMPYRFVKITRNGCDDRRAIQPSLGYQLAYFTFTNHILWSVRKPLSFESMEMLQERNLEDALSQAKMFRLELGDLLSILTLQLYKSIPMSSLSPSFAWGDRSAWHHLPCRHPRPRPECWK